MRSRQLALVVVLLVGVLLAAPQAALAAKDYRAERYDVRLALEPGGSMVVTETVTFVFGADSFTQVSRGLPSRRTDGLTILSVTMDGRPFERGEDPGQYDVEKRDDGRFIVWHFPKTTASTHAFELTYRVQGVVQHAAGSDLLEWSALPTAHAYRIGCAAVTLAYPAGAVIEGAPSVEPEAERSTPAANPARFERCGFGKDEGWLVRASFAPRSIAPTWPDWQRRAVQARRRVPLFLGLGGMILLAGLVGFVAFGLNHRVLPPAQRHALRPTPPDDLPLLLGASLANNGQVTWLTVLAAVFELARRRIVRIEELEHSLLRGHDFAVVAAGDPAVLRPAERALYDVLFTAKEGPRSSLKFSELGKTIGSMTNWKRLTVAVKAGLKEARLIDAERSHTRTRATTLAIILLGLGFVGMIAAVPFIHEYGGATLTMGISIMVVALVGLAVALSLSPLTDEGVRRAQHWQAYGRHVKQLAKTDVSLPVSQARLDQTLPAAVAFGAADAWAKALHRHGATVGPSWLRALPREGHEAGHLQAVMAMLAAGHSAGQGVGHGAAGAAGVAAGGGSSAAR